MAARAFRAQVPTHVRHLRTPDQEGLDVQRRCTPREANSKYFNRPHPLQISLRAAGFAVLARPIRSARAKSYPLTPHARSKSSASTNTRSKVPSAWLATAIASDRTSKVPRCDGTRLQPAHARRSRLLLLLGALLLRTAAAAAATAALCLRGRRLLHALLPLRRVLILLLRAAVLPARRLVSESAGVQTVEGQEREEGRVRELVVRAAELRERGPLPRVLVDDALANGKAPSATRG